MKGNSKSIENLLNVLFSGPQTRSKCPGCPACFTADYVEKNYDNLTGGTLKSLGHGIEIITTCREIAKSQEEDGVNLEEYHEHNLKSAIELESIGLKESAEVVRKYSDFIVEIIGLVGSALNECESLKNKQDTPDRQPEMQAADLNT